MTGVTKGQLKSKKFPGNGVAITVLLLLIILFFRKVLFSGQTLFGDDILLEYFYSRAYFANTLAKHIFPLWNPYIFSGLPYLAETQSAVFYPFNWLFLFFPTHLAINYSIIFHFFLSGLFMYFLARYLRIGNFGALVSAIIFMFSFLFVGHIHSGHVSNLRTMAWFPLLLLFLEMSLAKRRFSFAALAGIVFAIQIFAGHIQYVFYTVLALFLYFLVRSVTICIKKRNFKVFSRLCLLFLCFVMVGVSLSAVQIIPSYELLQYSSRAAGGVSYEFATMNSLPPENLLTFFALELFGTSARGGYWGRWDLFETAGYFGVFSLMLVLLALLFKRRNEYVVTFSILALFSIILALGKYLPTYRLLFNFVPGFNLFRAPAKILFVFVSSAAILSGFGCKFLIGELENIQKKSLLRLTKILLAIGVLLLIFVAFFGARERPQFWENITKACFSLGDRYYSLPDLTESFLVRSFSTVIRSIAKSSILLVTGALLVIFWVKSKISSKVLKTLIFCLIMIDLWLVGSPFIPVGNLKEYCKWERELVDFFKREEVPFRIATPTDYVSFNKGMMYRVAHFYGNSPAMLDRYDDFINLDRAYYLGSPTAKVPQTLNLLNLKYIKLNRDREIDIPTLKLVFSTDCDNIYQNTQCLPRSFIVHKAKIITVKEEILNELKSKRFNPREYIILEEEPKSPTLSNKPLPAEEIEPLPKIVEYSSNRVVIEANLLSDGYLVLADVYYPGWKVYVDGKEDKIYPAYYTLRSVPLKEGKHTIKFVYDPLSFKIGLIISLLTLFSLSLLFKSSLASAIKRIPTAMNGTKEYLKKQMATGKRQILKSWKLLQEKRRGFLESRRPRIATARERNKTILRIDKIDKIIMAVMAIVIFLILISRLGIPSELYFDEINNIAVVKEQVLLKQSGLWAHPWLGELILAIGVLISRTNPFWMRLPSVIFATALLPLIYLFAKNLFRNRPTAFFAAFLLGLDGLYFVHARIAMSDIYVTFFIILAFYFFSIYLLNDLKPSNRPLLLSGVALGLAIATKWNALFALALVIFIILFVRLATLLKRYNLIILRKGERIWHLWPSEKETEKHLFEEKGTSLWKIGLYLIGIPIIIYLLSYLPSLRMPGHGLIDVFKHQKFMWQFHSGLVSSHPYSSKWWSWPLLLRPIWYYFHKEPNDMVSGVMVIGNPAIFWVSIPCLVYLGWKALKDRNKGCALVFIAFCFLYLPWALSPRSLSFFYYFLPVLPLICVAVAYCLGELWRTKLGKYIVICYLLAVLALFVYFYPLLSAYPISWEYYSHHIWFRGWI